MGYESHCTVPLEIGLSNAFKKLGGQRSLLRDGDGGEKRVRKTSTEASEQVLSRQSLNAVFHLADDEIQEYQTKEEITNLTKEAIKYALHQSYAYARNLDWVQRKSNEEAAYRAQHTCAKPDSED